MLQQKNLEVPLYIKSIPNAFNLRWIYCLFQWIGCYHIIIYKRDNRAYYHSSQKKVAFCLMCDIFTKNMGVYVTYLKIHTCRLCSFGTLQ